MKPSKMRWLIQRLRWPRPELLKASAKPRIVGKLENVSQGDVGVNPCPDAERGEGQWYAAVGDCHYFDRRTACFILPRSFLWARSSLAPSFSMSWVFRWHPAHRVITSQCVSAPSVL